ncbi:Ca(2+)-dependent cysteine protease [Phlyctochytrium bullatum]|nr:Ca(2+)-dependent cysteine protease [Phlyctochytrium bullatum]
MASVASKPSGPPKPKPVTPSQGLPKVTLVFLGFPSAGTTTPGPARTAIADIPRSTAPTSRPPTLLDIVHRAKKEQFAADAGLDLSRATVYMGPPAFAQVRPSTPAEMLRDGDFLVVVCAVQKKEEAAIKPRGMTATSPDAMSPWDQAPLSSDHFIPATPINHAPTASSFGTHTRSISASPYPTPPTQADASFWNWKRQTRPATAPSSPPSERAASPARKEARHVEAGGDPQRTYFVYHHHTYEEGGGPPPPPPQQQQQQQQQQQGRPEAAQVSGHRTRSVSAKKKLPAGFDGFDSDPEHPPPPPGPSRNARPASVSASASASTGKAGAGRRGGASDSEEDRRARRREESAGRRQEERAGRSASRGRRSDEERDDRRGRRNDDEDRDRRKGRREEEERPGRAQSAARPHASKQGREEDGEEEEVRGRGDKGHGGGKSGNGKKSHAHDSEDEGSSRHGHGAKGHGGGKSGHGKKTHGHDSEDEGSSGHGHGGGKSAYGKKPHTHRSEDEGSSGHGAKGHGGGKSAHGKKPHAHGSEDEGSSGHHESKGHGKEHKEDHKRQPSAKKEEKHGEVKHIFKSQHASDSEEHIPLTLTLTVKTPIKASHGHKQEDKHSEKGHRAESPERKGGSKHGKEEHDEGHGRKQSERKEPKREESPSKKKQGLEDEERGHSRKSSAKDAERHDHDDRVSKPAKKNRHSDGESDSRKKHGDKKKSEDHRTRAYGKSYGLSDGEDNGFSEESDSWSPPPPPKRKPQRPAYSDDEYDHSYHKYGGFGGHSHDTGSHHKKRFEGGPSRLPTQKQGKHASIDSEMEDPRHSHKKHSKYVSSDSRSESEGYDSDPPPTKYHSGKKPGPPSKKEEPSRPTGHASPPKPASPTKVVESYQVQRYRPSIRRAVLIGINYFNTKVELKGCIEDVKQIKKLLVSKLNYEDSPDSIRILTDDAKDPKSLPTRKNIVEAIAWLRRDVRPGDVLYFHFSGHGNQQVSSDSYENLDETLVPVDFKTAGEIVDNELNDRLVRGLPAGLRMTCVFDCCHSGTILDLPFQYSAEGKLLGQQDLMERHKSLEHRTAEADVILLSQTSADASFQGQPQGALTNALLATIREKAGMQLSFLEILRSVRTMLKKAGFTQVPQVSASHPIDINHTRQAFYI